MTDTPDGYEDHGVLDREKYAGLYAAAAHLAEPPREQTAHPMLDDE